MTILDRCSPRTRELLRLVALRSGCTVDDLAARVIETYAETWEFYLGDLVKERKAS